jgi:transcriptional regulator with XRE-family HTH domain
MPKKLILNVALTLKTIRKSRNISQENLAELAGLDRTYISGVERGVRNITLESLESIILALGIDVPTFLYALNENIKNNKGA